VATLKPGKHNGNMGLSSDHVKHACHEWFIYLFYLFVNMSAIEYNIDQLLIIKTI